MGILIYPEQSARDASLWPQLKKLTQQNASLMLFESDIICKVHQIG